jgi:hypothetical protein
MKTKGWSMQRCFPRSSTSNGDDYGGNVYLSARAASAILRRRTTSTIYPAKLSVDGTEVGSGSCSRRSR